MFEPFQMSQQQLRDMALNAMLLAVDAQAAALKSMDREHTFGLENSFTVDRLRDHIKDLVQSAHVIVKAGKACSLTETREKIQSLAAAARRMKDDADHFRATSAPLAKTRYDNMLLQMGLDEPKLAQDATETAASEVKASDLPAGEAPTSTEVGHEPRALTAQAGFACLRAEIDEYSAFAMQIHAVCNLALEYALNAAAESSRSNTNI